MIILPGFVFFGSIVPYKDYIQRANITPAGDCEAVFFIVRSNPIYLKEMSNGFWVCVALTFFQNSLQGYPQIVQPIR